VTGGVLPSVWRERAALWYARATPSVSPSEDISPPSITGRVGTSWAWARDTPSRDMAFSSACPRSLHLRAPLILLYLSLCRMSSPSNKRAAPRPAVLRGVLAGMLGVLSRGGAAATP
jgi:hypothetical protein